MGTLKDWQRLDNHIDASKKALNPTLQRNFTNGIVLTDNEADSYTDIGNMTTREIGAEITEIRRRWLKRNGDKRNCRSNQITEQDNALERLYALNRAFTKRLDLLD